MANNESKIITTEEQDRISFDHIPMHIRLTSPTKYQGCNKNLSARKKAGSTAGRKPGGDNKGRGLKDNVMILLHDIEIRTTTAKEAADISGLSYKTVLEYCKKNRVSLGGYSFKRV